MHAVHDDDEVVFRPIAGRSVPSAIHSRQTMRMTRTQATEYVGTVTAQPEWKFGVVVARFNSLVTKQLLEGAHEVFTRHGVPTANVDVSAGM